MPANDDEAIRRGLRAGLPEAFAALYDRCGARMYRTAVGMLGHAQDAEDAVQEVFASLVRSREQLARADDLTAYLFASLRRAAARIAARRSRLGAASAGDVEQVADTRAEMALGADDDADRLQRALRALPAEQREVIALKIDGELTFAEIGQSLGISANTAASRYRYALEKLRAAMQESPR